jgi:hypothetical protein
MEAFLDFVTLLLTKGSFVVSRLIVRELALLSEAAGAFQEVAAKMCRSARSGPTAASASSPGPDVPRHDGSGSRWVCRDGGPESVRFWRMFAKKVVVEKSEPSNRK